MRNKCCCYYCTTNTNSVNCCTIACWPDQQYNLAYLQRNHDVARQQVIVAENHWGMQPLTRLLHVQDLCLHGLEVFGVLGFLFVSIWVCHTGSLIQPANSIALDAVENDNTTVARISCKITLPLTADCRASNAGVLKRRYNDAKIAGQVNGPKANSVCAEPFDALVYEILLCAG